VATSTNRLRLRLRRGKPAHHLIGEAAAGPVSRRSLIRGGTVAGLSAPLAGLVLAARGSRSPGSASAGRSGAAAPDPREQTLAAQQASSPLPISGGGTGQTTAEAAFNALAPMTTTGDMVYDSSAAVAARLPIGAPSAHLMALSTGVPGWVSAVVNVMAYGAKGNGTTDDTTAIQNAVNAVSGGVVFVPPGTYPISKTITVPWNNTLIGSGVGTVLKFTATGDCLRMSNPTTPSQNYATQEDLSGGVRDLMIDGASAGTTAPSSGLHIGDGLGYWLSHLFIRNFTAAGSVGLHLDNSVSWTEKLRAYGIMLSNNATCCLIEQSTGTSSFEYCHLDAHCYLASGQSAVVVQGGAQWDGAMTLAGNVQDGATAYLTITGSSSGGAFSKIYDAQFWLRAETGGTITSPPQTINFGSASNVIQNCYGYMEFSGTWTASNAVPANLGNFRGIINGDTALQAAQGQGSVGTPALPATGVAYTNTFLANAAAYVSGGTVTSIVVNGVTTGLTSGTFLLPPGATITLNYTVAPSWKWVRAAT
jgi:hypothetical protein